MVPGIHNVFLADVLTGWFALLVPGIHKVVLADALAGWFALLVPGIHNVFLADILTGWFTLLVPGPITLCCQMLWRGGLLCWSLESKTYSWQMY